MVCERCGNTLPDQATTCPMCGMTNPQNRIQSPATPGPQEFSHHSTYPQGYTPQSNIRPSQPPTSYLPVQPPLPGYIPTYMPLYPTGYHPIPSIHRVRLSSKENKTLQMEIVLSLIGLFGIGWLLAGEIVPGVLLLLGSILIYWPMVLAGTALTDGLALIFLAPLAISIIILNALLFNGRLKRKATRVLFVPSTQTLPSSHIPLPPHRP